MKDPCIVRSKTCKIGRLLNDQLWMSVQMESGEVGVKGHRRSSAELLTPHTAEIAVAWAF